MSTGTDRIDALILSILADRRRIAATITARLDEVARLRTALATSADTMDRLLDDRLDLTDAPARAAMLAEADALAAAADVPPLPPPPATADDTGAYGPDTHHTSR